MAIKGSLRKASGDPTAVTLVAGDQTVSVTLPDAVVALPLPTPKLVTADTAPGGSAAISAIDLQLFRKYGVVIHQVLTAPDNIASFEITIDQSTCAALIADAKSRAESAEQKRSDSTQSATESNSMAEPKRLRTMTIRPDQTEQK